uniref:Uncharacterized protein n=1 Tax=Arion vulgaris TaxID=1028688 RepID=A0A0B7C1N2_9EUPU
MRKMIYCSLVGKHEVIDSKYFDGIHHHDNRQKGGRSIAVNDEMVPNQVPQLSVI